MATSTGGARPERAGKLFTAFATLLLTTSVGIAPAATTGGAPTPAGGPPPPGSPTGSPEAAPSAGKISVVSATASPRKSFYFGVRYPRLSYTIASTRGQNDLRIDVVRPNGRIVRSFYRSDVPPGVANTIRWDGSSWKGRPARNGKYAFRISAQSSTGAVAGRRRRATRANAIRLGFSLFGYAFPLLGAHNFGQAGARFGAGRSGHTHQGQDVMAKCGVPIVAARGGRIQFSGFQGAAGNYVVIDGKGTRIDTAYMHLRRPSLLRAGDLVRTGQPIGLVGRTGDATACHLHFEMWTGPGWYEGGRPLNPLPFLRRWDRYS